MALQGKFSGKTSNSFIKPTITWQAVQSVEGNYSDITATLTYSRTNRGYTTGGNWTGMLQIGDQRFAGSKKLEITYESNTVAMTATARVPHDDYGHLTVTVCAQGSIAGTSLEKTEISGQVTPDTIARASFVGAANGFIGSRTTVVVQRKNDSFTHSIAYRFGELSGYLDTEGNAVEQEVRHSATTISFLIPTAFYWQIPHEKQGICTLICTTYQGDTVIGVREGQFYAAADPGACSPLVVGSVKDCNPEAVALTGDENTLIRYVSTALCTVTAMPQNGALLAQTRIAGVQAGELEIPGMGLHQVCFEATDTRGFTANHTVDGFLIPYVTPTGHVSVQRTDATSGNALLTVQGNCWKGNFGAVENALTVAVQVADGPVQYYTPQPDENHNYRLEVTLSQLDYTQSHKVTVTVSDKAMSLQKELTVQKGFPVFDWGKEDFRFQVPVDVPELTVGGVSLKAYIQSIIEGG